MHDKTLTEHLDFLVTQKGQDEELGSERLAEIDDQRDALRRDVVWGLKGA
jgi:hypothetical protein